MNFSKDEIVPPAWINSDYVRKVIACDENSDIEVTNIAVAPASSASDHFASLIFRVKAVYSSKTEKDKNISIIVKTLPTQDGLKKDLVDSFDMFGYEGAIFSKVLPVCHKMLEDIMIDDLIGAKMFYRSKLPHVNIALQDLKELGYAVPTSNYLPDNVYRAMFEKLALLHATTFKMHADGNKDVTKFKGVFLNMPDITNVFLFMNGKDLLVDVMRTIPELVQCASKLQNISTRDLIRKCVEVINEPGLYNVLNHGDLYSKNMMTRSENDSVDVIFVDFQLCHWGSPAVDIAYIASCMPTKCRKEMIQHYFDTFTTTLKALKFNGSIPQMAELESDLKKRKCIELYVLIVSAPFMYVDETYTLTEHLDIDTFMANRDFIIKAMKDERYISLLKDLMPVYMDDRFIGDLAAR